MARESCNLDKDEAEILAPSSSSSSPTPATVSPPPASSASTSLFLKAASVQEFTAQRPERQVLVAAAEPVTVTAPEKKPDEEERPPAIRFANRCTRCRKKVGLTGFRCRCGELFCPRHRYSDTHDCSFDYKAAGREEISKNNPLIRAAKIIKI